MSDKKILHIISISTLVALLFSFLFADAGRIIAAVLMAIACAATMMLLKKRGIPNFVYSEVAMIMAVIAAVYVMIYYLTGLKFGYYRTDYVLSADTFFKYVLPITAIILSTELTRNVMRAQEDKAASILSYAFCVVAEVLIHYALSDILNFKKFMDIIALALLPAILSNLLYHYLAKRYGILPNVAYRLITTLYPYLIPYKTRVPDSLLSFANLILPVAIYLFIDYLYEKKKKYALSRSSKIGVAITLILVMLMSALVLLVSNTTRFGAYVIATESMTGELNKGDIAIYEQYDTQEIKEGQVVVFSKNGNQVIHRVVDIAHINGQTRYYTKGDANSTLDAGYITDGDILGLVDIKLPYFGYPTLWLRELVKNTIQNAK